MFSAVVDDYWFRSVSRADVPEHEGLLRIAVDADLPHNRRVMVLELAGSGGIATVTPEVADRLGVQGSDTVAATAFTQLLAANDIALNGKDALFYLPQTSHDTLSSEAPAAHVRRLTSADADLFAQLEATAPADDLDEAFVELDHWIVFGAIIDGRLVTAASMYPWTGTKLADLGVITLPAYRGRGLGRDVVRALAAHAIDLDYEPQYRCQLDNAPSVALASSAGLQRLGDWDVVREAD